MKFWLSIILIIAICGLAVYIVMLETGWNIAREPSEQPLNIVEIIQRAKTCREEGQPENAVELLEEALEENPDNFVLIVELGKSHEQNGDIDLALIMYEKTSTINPDQYLPYRLLGFLYLNHKKDRIQAQKYFEKSIALNPNQHEVKMFLDSMKAKPPVASKPPSVPVAHTPEPHPRIPTPKVPDPRPKIPTPPRPTGR
jgi:tetratricopeptide (TPR) repeat protein